MRSGGLASLFCAAVSRLLEVWPDDDAPSPPLLGPAILGPASEFCLGPLVDFMARQEKFCERLALICEQKLVVAWPPCEEPAK